jgi:hypothetical protein
MAYHAKGRKPGGIAILVTQGAVINVGTKGTTAALLWA